ncbi:MAG: 3-dehydroquinate synthase [Clostridia bacterium]|nr:3-dehydroquinate synthase [Clostridia bacterium]
MYDITVNASKTYHVYADRGLLEKTGEYAKNAGLSGKAAIISDDMVAPLYGDKVRSSLEKQGFEVYEFVFEHGEKSKNSDTFIEILNFLARNHFSRKDTLFALGGGVTGDMTGFCAASFMRGINYVQLATSLLAMVDSSVGGKTAIDLKYGKNLAGAFYQPEFVLCDIDSLQTLPEEFFTDGMAEVIKYAMIYDESMESLICGGAKDNIQNLIARCIEIKSEIVHLDEFEGGLRKILNFGHTAGHGVEARSEYTISHGKAVAIGMYLVANALEKSGECALGTTKRLVTMLDICGLSHDCPYSANELAEAAKNDKKAAGASIDLVTVSRVGKSDYKKISMEELKNLISKGLE